MQMGLGFGRAALGAAALACGLAATPAWAEDGALAVVEGYLAAWNAHDAAAAAAFFADDVTYYDASVGAPVSGREAAQTDIIESFLNAVPDASWQMSGAPVVNADAVAFEWTFAGTNTGDWGDGTAATGKPFTLHGLSLIRVEDGKIAYQGDYYDALGFYGQLGLLE
ncbi:MAG: nuclear transport factor 2 family protein [Alphaproteobacteria bacterium]